MHRSATLLAATLLALPLASACTSEAHSGTDTAKPDTAKPTVEVEMGTTAIPKFLHDRWAKQWQDASVYDAPAVRAESTGATGATLTGYSLYPCVQTITDVAPTPIDDYQETLRSDPANKVEAHAAVVVFSAVNPATRFAKAVIANPDQCTHLSTKADPKVALGNVAVTFGGDDMVPSNTKSGDYHAPGHASDVLGRFTTRVVQNANVVVIIDGWQDTRTIVSTDALPSLIDTLQNQAAELVTWSLGK